MVRSAIELRKLGDASDEQRTKLRDLITRKAVTNDWVQRFYDDVRAADGLTAGRAAAALTYLGSLPDKDTEPTYATTEQGEELRELIRTRIVPSLLARMWIQRLDAGQLTYIEAGHAITDYRRLPMRVFVPPADAPPAGSPGAEAPDGYFALTGSDGSARCYRVHTRGGVRLVDQITGTRPGKRRRIRGWQAVQIMQAVHADVPAAARLYGATRKHCSGCNRPLHDETQDGYPHGYGPDCWAELQATATTHPSEENA